MTLIDLLFSFYSIVGLAIISLVVALGILSYLKVVAVYKKLSRELEKEVDPEKRRKLSVEIDEVGQDAIIFGVMAIMVVATGINVLIRVYPEYGVLHTVLMLVTIVATYITVIVGIYKVFVAKPVEECLKEVG